MNGKSEAIEETNADAEAAEEKGLSGFIAAAGVILAISYPVLALSTGVRALYQLFFKEGVTNYLAPTLSLVASLLYLIATVGFAVREKWAWRISVAALATEMVMVLLVGTLSLIIPDTIGRTAWRYFGIDYAFFPFIQPVLGLLWLFHPKTLVAYGIRESGKD
ncbi:MAG: hypothetical protein JSV68_04775 [Anaerolineaceae bacterium]|jgi:lysylphosphatidylglycerol synthetase-like protein (DUF2156 family)|nr:MAG: hypothetical protein JSV68_04775 [Anaerolineaceae bacterium]